MVIILRCLQNWLFIQNCFLIFWADSAIWLNIWLKHVCVLLGSTVVTPDTTFQSSADTMYK